MSSLEFAAPVAVSIVIPTFDRPDALRRCLEALAAQELVEALEIIVVLDDPAGSSRVRDAVSATPDASLVQGSGRGPAAARNAGIEAAIGDYILFTDDDCRPDPGWAGALVDALSGGAEVVAGTTVNGEASNQWAEASQHIANFVSEHGESGSDRGAGDGRAVGDGAGGRKAGGGRAGDGRAPGGALPTLSFAASNNLGVRAAIATAIPFDEDYPLPAGEDRDWCVRVIEAGHSIHRVADAVVHHHQQLDRRSFWRQQRNYGQGARRFARENTGGGLPSDRSLYPALIRSAFRKGPGVGARVMAAQLATAAGYRREQRAEQSGERRAG